MSERIRIRSPDTFLDESLRSIISTVFGFGPSRSVKGFGSPKEIPVCVSGSSPFIKDPEMNPYDEVSQ